MMHVHVPWGSVASPISASISLIFFCKAGFAVANSFTDRKISSASSFNLSPSKQITCGWSFSKSLFSWNDDSTSMHVMHPYHTILLFVKGGNFSRISCTLGLLYNIQSLLPSYKESINLFISLVARFLLLAHLSCSSYHATKEWQLNTLECKYL